MREAIVVVAFCGFQRGDRIPNPKSGSVPARQYLSCQSQLVTIRRIKRATWALPVGLPRHIYSSDLDHSNVDNITTDVSNIDVVHY